MWLLLAVCSAIGLGFYDIAKKQALRENGVVMVLFLSVAMSSLLLLPNFVLSRLSVLGEGALFFVPRVDLATHLYIVGKAALVLSSWVCAYAAMKHLPITLVSPLNATRPMWTLLGALVLFGERLNGWQWLGIIVALASFYAFSVIGRKEGVTWKDGETRVWLLALLAAILLGAASGLYDKYLMRRFDHNAVQVYYTWYQALMMAAVALLTGEWRKGVHAYGWILLISVFLVAADFVYFVALSYPESLISVISTIRRSGCILPFIYGVFVLKDRHPKGKALCLLGVLLGIVCLLLGSLYGM